MRSWQIADDMWLARGWCTSRESRHGFDIVFIDAYEEKCRYHIVNSVLGIMIEKNICVNEQSPRVIPSQPKRQIHPSKSHNESLLDAMTIIHGGFLLEYKYA